MYNASNVNPIFKNSNTIDYFLWCPSLFKYINNFIVHDGNPLFADDHSMLEQVIIKTGITQTVMIKNAINRARRRCKVNKCEENVKLIKLMGKEYNTIIIFTFDCEI